MLWLVFCLSYVVTTILGSLHGKQAGTCADLVQLLDTRLFTLDKLQVCKVKTAFCVRSPQGKGLMIVLRKSSFGGASALLCLL